MNRSLLHPEHLCERYLRFWGVVLLGYMLMGRSFAYLGLPPLFIGEILMLCGVGTVLLCRWGWVIAGTGIPVLLLLFMGWCGIQTVRHVRTYQLDSLRDAAIYYYGILAMVIAILLVERPERLRMIWGWMRKLVVLVLVYGPVM